MKAKRHAWRVWRNWGRDTYEAGMRSMGKPVQASRVFRDEVTFPMGG